MRGIRWLRRRSVSNKRCSLTLGSQGAKETLRHPRVARNLLKTWRHRTDCRSCCSSDSLAVKILRSEVDQWAEGDRKGLLRRVFRCWSQYAIQEPCLGTIGTGSRVFQRQTWSHGWQIVSELGVTYLKTRRDIWSVLQPTSTWPFLVTWYFHIWCVDARAELFLITSWKSFRNEVYEL